MRFVTIASLPPSDDAGRKSVLSFPRSLASSFYGNKDKHKDLSIGRHARIFFLLKVLPEPAGAPVDLLIEFLLPIFAH